MQRPTTGRTCAAQRCQPCRAGSGYPGSRSRPDGRAVVPGMALPPGGLVGAHSAPARPGARCQSNSPASSPRRLTPRLPGSAVTDCAASRLRERQGDAGGCQGLALTGERCQPAPRRGAAAPGQVAPAGNWHALQNQPPPLLPPRLRPLSQRSALRAGGVVFDFPLRGGRGVSTRKRKHPRPPLRGNVLPERGSGIVGN